MLLLLEYIRETDKWMMLELNFNADMVIVKNFNGSIELIENPYELKLVILLELNNQSKLCYLWRGGISILTIVTGADRVCVACIPNPLSEWIRSD